MTRQHYLKHTLPFVAAAMVSLGTAASPSVAANFYDGKTITIVVGLAPGGTVDTFARAFSKAWQRHIPGNPTMIVKNMTGGGGMKATNFVYEAAEKDGLTILWTSWMPIAQALNYKGFRARYEKMPFLGGTPDIRIAYARTDIIPGGLKKPIDFLKAKDIYIGGNAATGSAHLSGRIPLDVLGVNYQQIVGYRGGSSIFLAMQQGEIQYTATSIGTFRQRSGAFVKEGKAMGLFYLVPVAADGSYKRNRYINEMPSFPDFYKEAFGKMPSGPKWDALNWFVTLIGAVNYVGFAPPGTPKPVVDALRTGYEKGSADPAFVNMWSKRNGIPPEFVGYEEGEQIVKSLASTDPKILATFKEMVEQGSKSARQVKKQPKKK